MSAANSAATADDDAAAAKRVPAVKKLSITSRRHEDEREPDKAPLDLRLITRLIGYMRPYAAKRNVLFLCVLLRGIQLPLIGLSISAVIKGPIKHHAELTNPIETIVLCALGVLVLTGFTQFVLHFRQRLALELGEAVIHDLRREIFAHLQAMPMSFYNTTKIGRIISRVTSDCEALRIGVQDVLVVSLVGVIQMTVSAAIMLYYDWALFSIVVAMGPIIYFLNLYFRGRLSTAYRIMQEGFSRLTSPLAESINGVRLTLLFVRHEANSQLVKNVWY